MAWYKIAQLATKQQLVQAIVQVKGTLIDNGSSVSCLAPHKMIWNSSSNHELSIMYERGWKKGEVYYELLQEVLMGVSQCNDPECEWCSELGNEGSPMGLPYGTNPRDCIVINGVLQQKGVV
jgi:hypothetical protein